MNPSLNKNIYFNYLVQVVNTVVNFIFSLVIVRQLGAAEYGNYAVFYNSIVFATLALGFNLPSVIIFFIANQKIQPGKLLYTSILILLAATISLLGLLTFSDKFGLAVHIFPGGENRTAWIFFFIAMYFLLQVNQVLQAYLNAHKSFVPVAMATMWSNIILLLCWLLITSGRLHLPGGTFNLVWITSIGANLIIFFFSLWQLKNTSLSAFGKLINKREWAMIATFGGIVYLCNTIQFLNYKLDIWLVNDYLGNKESGVYSLALSLSQLIWILPNAASGVLLNYYSIQHKHYSVQIAARYGAFSIYASVAMATALSLVYYYAIPLIYGPAFRETASLCLVLFLGVIPFSLSIILANLNSGIGLVRLNLYATVFTFVLGLLLDLLIIPEHGLWGAAWVKAGVYCSGLIFQLMIAIRHYRVPMRLLLMPPSLKRIFSIK